MSTSTLVPANSKRKLERLSAKNLKNLKVQIHFDDETIEAPIIDFNSKGLGIDISTLNSFKLPDASQMVRVSVSINKKILVRHEPAFLTPRRAEGILGISFSKELIPRGIRSSERLKTLSNFQPMIMIAHPLEISNVVHLRIVDFNSKGFKATTSLSNKDILPQMELTDGHIILPGVGMEKVDVRIIRIESGGKELTVGGQFLNSSSELHYALAQFALFGAEERGHDIFGKLTAADLKAKDVSRAIRIRPISSAEEYVGVLKVRLDAYRAAKKVPDQSSYEDMADEFDERSIILAAQVKGKVLATARLVECVTESDRFPCEQYHSFDSLGLESSRKNFFEVSRLAISPTIQGSNLLIRFFQEMSKYTMIHKEYALCAATKATRTSYEKLGWKKISDEVPHPSLPGESLAIFEIASKNFRKGRGMSGIAWYKAAKPVVDSLARLNYVEPPRAMPRKALLRAIERLVLKLKS